MLKAAYALQALPEGERLAFEAYLSEHPELREEAEWLASLAGLLVLAREEREPPPHSRSTLLSRIGHGAPGPSARERLFSRARRLLSPRGLATAGAVLLVGLLLWHLSIDGDRFRRELRKSRSEGSRAGGRGFPRQRANRDRDS